MTLIVTARQPSGGGSSRCWLLTQRLRGGGEHRAVGNYLLGWHLGEARLPRRGVTGLGELCASPFLSSKAPQKFRGQHTASGGEKDVRRSRRGVSASKDGRSGTECTQNLALSACSCITPHHQCAGSSFGMPRSSKPRAWVSVSSKTPSVALVILQGQALGLLHLHPDCFTLFCA